MSAKWVDLLHETASQAEIRDWQEKRELVNLGGTEM